MRSPFRPRAGKPCTAESWVTDPLRGGAFRLAADAPGAHRPGRYSSPAAGWTPDEPGGAAASTDRLTACRKTLRPPNISYHGESPDCLPDQWVLSATCRFWRG